MLRVPGRGAPNGQATTWLRPALVAVRQGAHRLEHVDGGAHLGAGVRRSAGASDDEEDALGGRVGLVDVQMLTAGIKDEGGHGAQQIGRASCRESTKTTNDRHSIRNKNAER